MLDHVLNRILPPEPRAPSERAFEREILTSERKRMGILAALIGALWVVYSAGAFLFPERIATVLGSRPWLLHLFFAGIGAYELLVRHLAGRVLALRRQPPAVVRYANAALETSFPTLAMLILGEAAGFDYALTSPASTAYFLFIVLSTLRLDLRLSLLTGAVAAGEYAAVLFGCFGFDLFSTEPAPELSSHIARVVFYFAAGVCAGLVAQELRRQFLRALHAAEERNRILGMFGQHVSPAVAEQLLAHATGAEGELRDVCLMFVDIRNFTAFAEQCPPREIMQYLNRLFGFMIDSVNRHQGVISKFLGDGFMAVFGAPLASERPGAQAVAAAREILARVDELNAAQAIPPTRIGIGLHMGEVVTGLIGTAERREYALVGDAVNVAARIEELNKEFDSRLLLSERVRQAASEQARDAVPLGAVTIRGHRAALELYRLA